VNIGGHKINKWWLIGGAGGVAAAVVIYRKASSSSNSADSSTDPSAIDPVTGLPYSEDDQTDPLTGMTYLSEAQQYGSVSAAEAAISAGGGYLGSGEDSGYPTIYPGDGGTGTTTSGSTYSTNAQWAQAVTAGLTGIGYSSTDIAAALGQYFQSMPLGSGSDGVSYLGIMQAAIAEFGPPPVGTFPLTGKSGTGGTGGTGGVTHTYTVTASNANTLDAIAIRNHNSPTSVASLNASLYSKYGGGGKLPVGTDVTLPYAQ
jgi:hypothetical protein